MARDPGDRLRNAQSIALSSGLQQFRNSVGRRDRADLYQFQLANRSLLNLSLSSRGADLRLLNSAGRRIAQGQTGQRQETIATNLAPGTYYIQVVPSRRRVRATYRLTAAASPTDSAIGNSNPTVAIQPLTVQRGQTSVIPGTTLRAADPNQAAAQLRYTLTRLPQFGQLLLNGAPLNAGGQFTQADIDSGQLSYASQGLAAQLTRTGTNEIGEDIDGANVIWNVSNSQTQLVTAFFTRSEEIRAFFYNGATGAAIPLRASNTSSELVLGISGENAVWNGIDTRDGDIEVFLYEGATGSSRQLTDNRVDEFAAGISGNNVAWNTFDGSAVTRAFFYSGDTGRTVQLTHPNSSSDQAIAVSGSNVVWSGFDGNDLEVFLYSGAANRSIQLTDNDVDDIPEAISGANVIWNSLVSRTASQAFFYSGATGQITRLTTSGSSSEAARSVSGNTVAWDALINGSSEVFLYDAATNTSKRLTTNQNDDVTLGLSGSNLVYGSTVNGQTQLFFYSGETATPLNDPNTPALFSGLSGFNLALTLSSGTNSEVFLYNMRNASATDQFGFTVSDSAGGSVDGTFSIGIS